MKKTLEKRLAHLYSGELFSIITFVPVSYFLNYAFPNLQLYTLYSFWVSFILLEFLLLQATIYWYVKLKRLRNENNPITPIKVIRQLHCLKTVNKVMIPTTIVVFVFDVIKWYPSLPLGGLTITFFIYIFAGLEFINYFYIQLSYDNVSDVKNLLRSRKLKNSCMNKDFKRILKLEL
ncbi:general stress protein [Salipaludibacillus neizhouensis]|uniref:General stress protein n=1 Tax=Salipaludibacillus neizhouensis TaxID=885475 RepID=A0A3A9KAC3_9BACI|nr:general stress protein [Salipaludibacillus neizhouensis]RKL66523.1 general stress protein [Salipaludibacillus neizhouensis]